MHNKKMFDLENEGQGHEVQHLPWCHSMVNINLDKYDKSHLRNYYLLSPFSRYSHLKIGDLENVCQGHDLQHSQWRHSMANTGLPI